MNGRRRVLIAYTGGTIGMRKDARGYRPESGFLQELVERFAPLHAPEVPEFVIEQYDPLLDSANVGPSEWLRIAEGLRAREHEYDGFLVLHGTDTMAYTASALSFMLEDLSKPVILTGSQIPLAEVRNDARDNLLTALMILQEYGHRIGEVCLYFHHRLFRGNRATKVDVEGFESFASPSLDPLGEVGVGFSFRWDRIRSPGTGMKVHPIGRASVGTLRLFPGIQAGFVDSIVNAPVQGLVLECFGAGNVPSRNRELLEGLRRATDRGVVVVAVSQPLKGSAALDRYEAGSALADVGVVSGYDMTPEAALTKLMYLFDKGGSPEEVAHRVSQDLRGEITVPEVYSEPV